ncbi:hypothetical protein [Sagittula sp. S175]|uniref:hypothetical protein n=1 Tax=Sagittula sp. S175 TaxID=3415129 RepID=UPI003C7A6B0E
MDNKAVLYGVGGVLIGLLGGVAVGGATSANKMQRALDRALAPAQEAQASASSGTQEALTAIQERLAALEAAVGEAKVDPAALAGEVSAGVGSQTEGLAAKLDEMQSTLGGRIDEAAKAQSEAVKAALADMSAGMADSARIAAAAVVAAEGDGGGTEVAGKEISAALGVGETAVFADGALRVFVSRLDTQGGSARLMVNGETASAGIGGTVATELDGQACAVSVMTLSDEGVTLGSDCGAADAASGEGAAVQEDAGSDEAATAQEDTGSDEGSEGQTAAAPASQPASDEAMTNSAKAGNTLRFADGALRAYVVAVDEDAQTARVAVNGVRQTRMAVGESIEVPSGEQTCTLTLQGLRDGAAGFDGACQ